MSSILGGFVTLALVFRAALAPVPANAAPQDPVGGAADGAGLLSPERWADGEADRYLRLNRVWGSDKPEAVGERAMVVGTSGAFAVRAGLEAYRQGGSAMDMALTTAFSQIVLAAGSWNSFAGILSLVVYDKKAGKIYALDAGYDVPLGEKEPATIPRSPTPSGRTTLVPGFMTGAEAAHRRFGSLPFRSLFDPAILLAEKGFTLDSVVGGLIQSRRSVLSRRNETLLNFADEKGNFYRSGDTFRQPALAATLRAVAANGAKEMIDGEWAKAFVRAVQGEDGQISLEDLRSYRPTWSDPLQTRIRGLDFYAPPTSGGIHALESLNLLELADVRGYETEAEPLFWFIQVARMGTLISYSGDRYLDYLFPKLGFTPERRVSKQNALTLWEKMSVPGWMRTFQGLPEQEVEEEGVELPELPDEDGSGGHSDGVVAVDGDGNVVALIHTINTTAWGSTGIFVNGVSIPDSGSFQQEKMRKVGPGGRVPHEMNPLIALRSGEIALASASIGSSLHEMTLQCIHRVLDRGMTPREAVRGPFFWGMKFGVDPDGKSTHYQQIVGLGSFPADVLTGVRGLGQPLAEVGSTEERGYRGYWVGISRVGSTMRGCGSRELNGYALGE